MVFALQWRHNELAGVSNHQPHDCLLNLIQTLIKENIIALRHWPLCGNSPGTGEFPAQMASNAENVSTWWRHHEKIPRPHHLNLCVTGYGFALFPYDFCRILFLDIRCDTYHMQWGKGCLFNNIRGLRLTHRCLTDPQLQVYLGRTPWRNLWF